MQSPPWVPLPLPTPAEVREGWRPQMVGPQLAYVVPTTIKRSQYKIEHVPCIACGETLVACPSCHSFSPRIATLSSRSQNRSAASLGPLPQARSVVVNSHERSALLRKLWTQVAACWGGAGA